MRPVEKRSSIPCFGGLVEFYGHESQSTGTSMEFSVFLPPAAAQGPVPVLYWLSGLTCTAENFTAKAGAQRYAAEHGIALVAPDTSPRGAGIPGEDEDWDFGTGAGFYVNATQPGWRDHYRMYDYVVHELPELVRSLLPLRADRESISGHSMGGHGALICALRNPGRYRSLSVFAPISTPSLCHWGEKAFGAYLGPDRATWREWDANELIPQARERLPILIDQGSDDGFLDNQLKPEVFADTCKRAGHPQTLRMREGYDHSYYFVASFIGEHIAHHARALLG